VANQEQLTLLEQGAYDWDEWRTENPDVNIDLSGADLSNADLSDVNLSGADLSDVNLSSADLNHANLSEANLSSADLNHANLSEVDFSGADLTMADLSSTDLRDANLHDANLSDTKLNKANISGADLTGANLNSADLSGADLNFANFRDADLSGANLSGTNLSDGIQIDPKWKLVHELVNEGGAGGSLGDADLSHAFLNGVNLSYADLSHTNLSHTNLNDADLSHANLNDADLSHANLSGANLAATQVLVTDFTGANFTGACLEDWHNNSETKLDDVICEYFYGKQNQQERHPGSGSFKPKEFILLIQKALETVDLIFANGIDWKAFFASFQELRAKHGDDNLSIQAIEKKSGGAFVIRLEVSPELDKATIEYQAKQLYEGQIRQLEERVAEYRNDVRYFRQSNTNLERIIQTMAENQSPKYDLRGSNIGNLIDTAQSGSQQSNVQYINMSQDLTQAAQQIQDLLQQLQNQGVTVEDSQQQVADGIAKQAEVNPTMMGKLVLWGKAMANKASETTVSEAAKIVFTLALKAAGVS